MLPPRLGVRKHHTNHQNDSQPYRLILLTILPFKSYHHSECYPVGYRVWREKRQPVRRPHCSQPTKRTPPSSRHDEAVDYALNLLDDPDA